MLDASDAVAAVAADENSNSANFNYCEREPSRAPPPPMLLPPPSNCSHINHERSTRSAERTKNITVRSCYNFVRAPPSPPASPSKCAGAVYLSPLDIAEIQQSWNEVYDLLDRVASDLSRFEATCAVQQADSVRETSSDGDGVVKCDTSSAAGDVTEEAAAASTVDRAGDVECLETDVMTTRYFSLPRSSKSDASRSSAVHVGGKTNDQQTPKQFQQQPTIAALPPKPLFAVHKRTLTKLAPLDINSRSANCSPTQTLRRRLSERGQQKHTAESSATGSQRGGTTPTDRPPLVESVSVDEATTQSAPRARSQRSLTRPTATISDQRELQKIRTLLTGLESGRFRRRPQLRSRASSVDGVDRRNRNSPPDVQRSSPPVSTFT